jgi:hypothetical protein
MSKDDNKLHDAEYLLSQIAAGMTLYIKTWTVTTKIDKRAVDRFAKINRAILINDSKGALRMSSGNHYVDCSFAAINLRKE